MDEQNERHGDASAVFDCLKYHASAGVEYEYRGTLAIEAFDRICTTLLDLKAQRDELLARLRESTEQLDAMSMSASHAASWVNPVSDATDIQVAKNRAAIAIAENPPCA